MDIDVVVVIVTYKVAKLTIECLRSIESERLTPGLRIRAIVVDNASNDAPLIAQAIETNDWGAWVTLLESPINGGFAYGNNVAFKRAYEDGPPAYIHVLNPDTLLRKGSIASLVKYLEDCPAIGIAGSSLENLEGDCWPVIFRFPTLLSELDYGLQLGFVTHFLKSWVVARRVNLVSQPADWICGASMMIRRAVIDKIGGFDENYFLYFEETDFCYRAKKAGFSTWYVPESRVMHIAGQSTNVTNPKAEPIRLPAYWFESRRRYFVATYGTAYAMAVDAIAICAHGIGFLKRSLLGRKQLGVPHFIRDLFRHSVIRPRNRKLPIIKSFVPTN